MSKAMASEAKFPPGYFNGNSWEVTIELFICYKALQLNFNAARSIRVQQPSSDLSKAEVKVPRFTPIQENRFHSYYKEPGLHFIGYTWFPNPLDISFLIIIYNFLIWPHFGNCLTVWDSKRIGLSTKLQSFRIKLRDANETMKIRLLHFWR